MGHVPAIPSTGGIFLDVRVIPRAGRSGIAGARNEALLVRVNAPPIDGAANTELIEVLARAFDVPRRNVTLVSGQRSRIKYADVNDPTARRN